MQNIVWNFINNFSTRGLLFVFFLVLGNALTPNDMGVFVSLMLFLTFSQMIFGYQLGPGIVHKLNTQSTLEGQDTYYSAGLILTLLMAVLATLVTYFGLEFIGEILKLSDHLSMIWMIAPLLMLKLMRDYLFRVIQAHSLFKRLAIINGVGAFIQLGVCLLLLQLGYGLFGVIVALYIAAVISLVALVVLAWKVHRFIGLKKDVVKSSSDLMKFCGYIFLAAIVVFLDTKIDVFLVNFYLSKDQVAVYAYAIEFALVLTLIGDSISQVNFPKLSKAFSLSDHGTVNALYSKSLRYTFFVVSFCAMIGALFSEVLINLVLPPHYLSMMPVLSVLLIGIVPFATLSSVGTIMTSKGIPLYDAIPVTISLVLNVVLSVILIPRIGLMGAAIATTISFQLRAILGVYMIERKTDVSLSYIRFIFVYMLFVVMVLAGGKTISIGYNLIEVMVYVAVCYILLLDHDDRNGVKCFLLARR